MSTHACNEYCGRGNLHEVQKAVCTGWEPVEVCIEKCRQWLEEGLEALR